MQILSSVALQVSTKLFDHLITRSTKAYKRGMQSTPTRKVVVRDCRLVPGAGPPMAFIEHCIRHCAHLEVVQATGFGGVAGAFHMNDLLMLLRTLNRIRPAPQVHLLLSVFHGQIDTPNCSTTVCLVALQHTLLQGAVLGSILIQACTSFAVHHLLCIIYNLADEIKSVAAQGGLD